MRIVSLLILSLFVFSGIAVASNPVKYWGIARGLIWDIRPIDVEKHEQAKLLKREEQRLFYSDQVHDRKATIGYQFNSDKLNRIRIDIHEHYADVQKWIPLFMEVQSDLTDQWGTPLSEDLIWRDEYEKNFPDNWGAAVFQGHLDIVIKWADNETLVTAQLKATKKFNPAISIIYEKRLPAKKLEESSVPLDDDDLVPFSLP